MNPGFGRRVSKDERDGQFRMRSLAPVELPKSRLWTTRRTMVLNQGQTSACTGFAWAGFLAAAPWLHHVSAAVARSIYKGAQENDEWDGSDYEGSSVRGGAKGLVLSGRITGDYVWGTTESEVWDFVRGRGPVVVGTSWLERMSVPDRWGYLDVSGDDAGGHAWLIVGASAGRHAYRMVNSWGLEWGDFGRAWLHREDFKVLLEEMDGEACSAIEVAK